MIEQLSLDIVIKPETTDVAIEEYRMSDRAWERCRWLEEILARLPLDFVFTEHCSVIEDEGVYTAWGCCPHEWQDFVWHGDDEWWIDDDCQWQQGGWELGDSDTGRMYRRVDKSEFEFILVELKRKKPMPINEFQGMRAWLEEKVSRNE
ncbi:MAG: hypothetical protein AAFY26_06120 [Cyanobacteria bacterium J06638_22]